MTFVEKLSKSIKKQNSLLVVGLDVDLDRMPSHLRSEKQPMLTFARRIIDVTADHVCAYKPNFAFFEAYGPDGLEQLQQIIDYIPKTIPVIGDAKRGDIGNTARMYAKALYDIYNVDAVTVNPYIGRDSILPFIQTEGTYAFVLGCTSNPSAADIEFQMMNDGREVYWSVIDLVKELNALEGHHCGVVVGATQPDQLKTISQALHKEFLLLPGVGAQGAQISDVFQNISSNPDRCLIAASRSVIYAGDGKDFHKQAENAALKMKKEINNCRG